MKDFVLIRLKLPILFSSLLVFLQLLYPQTDKNEETLKHEVTVTVKLVQIYVTDKNGNPVTDLSKDEFELYDNGKAQKISYFERYILPISEKRTKELKPSLLSKEEKKEIISSRTNRRFFLFFDFAFNNPVGILRSKRGALHFIDTQLYPTDEVGILSYSTKKGLIMHEYLTKDHKRIRKVVEGLRLKDYLGRAEKLEDIYSGDVEIAVPSDVKGETDKRMEEIEEKMESIRGAERSIYKDQVLNFISVMEELAKALRYIPYQKNIIFFSSGVANFVFYGDLERMWDGDILCRDRYEKMIEELKVANCSIYSVNVGKIEPRVSPASEAMRGDRSLRQISKETGGRYFHNTVEPERAVEEIQNLTSTYYVLGYSIDEKWDGKYHEIKVKVRRKGCEVYGQRGYFNPKPFKEYTEFEKLLHLIDFAVSEKPLLQEAKEFPLSLTPIGQDKNIFEISFEISLEELLKVGEELEVVMIFFDSKKGIIKVNGEKVKDISERIKYKRKIEISPDTEEVRVVVRNLSTGKSVRGIAKKG